MKRIFILITLLWVASLFAANLERIQDFGNGLNARFEGLRANPLQKQQIDDGEEDEFPQTALTARTYAFPYKQVNLQVNNMSWRVFDSAGQYQYTRSEILPEAVTLCQPFTFREMQGVTVKINTQLERGGQILTLDALDYDLTGSELITLPTSVSPAFIDAYRELADNWEYSYLRNLPVARPKMLIISHAPLANYLQGFTKWKKQLGFETYVINKADAGQTLDQIKNTIRNHYAQYQADYLLLLGDTTGNFSIPTSFYPSPEYSENDADDQYYALLEGEDYFPEMLVGRFSFNDIMEFIVMISKTVRYESNPSMDDPGWMKRALTVAGNYAEGGLRPSTPVSMSRWLRDRLLGYGYTQVDTVYYPPSYPGTSLISQAINNGVQLISYRGWGDANGWHYPSFHMPDLNNTYNGAKMPVVFSIVCNTGDFANSVNPSFGEKWMRMGTTANPNGCVAFVGPSDLHTKTRLNNSISSGAFRSILDYGVRGFGSSVLLGKIELYKNFLNDIAPGQYVPFYFHVYNILSDPSMNMWILQPGTISESIIEGGLTFKPSASHIRINAPQLEGAMVSGSKDGTNFSYAKVVNGVAILNINPEQSGDLLLTVSKPNYVPLVRTLTAGGAASIGVAQNTLADAKINANLSVSGTIRLKNYSDTALNGIIPGFDACSNLNISLDNPGTFDLPAGASYDLAVNIQANHLVRPDDVFNLTLRTQNPATAHEFCLSGGGARISVYAHQGTLQIGQSSNITFTLANIGTANLTGATVRAYSRTEAALISGAPIQIGDIPAGTDATFSVTIDTPSDIWNGRNIPLRFVFTDSSGYEWMSLYAITAGTAGMNSPTGPDEYGYFAYDNTDTGFAMKPVYQWTEIDPLLGGSGNVWEIVDDGVLQVDLPFNFRFYGRDYQSVSISSNGWLSFEYCDDPYFNNHYIPAALGPKAMVAGYWDDLKGMKTGDDTFANMRIVHWYDAVNNRFIVEWNDAYNQYTIQAGANASLEKFQIILYPKANADGDILIQYHTVDNPGTTTNYCTVGIEDHRQLAGLTYTYCNFYPNTAAPLAAGRAIRFTTTAPDNYLSNQDNVADLPLKNLRNYPNPFNPTTTIGFESRTKGEANLAVYNLKGQLVRKLYQGQIEAGNNSFVWDGTDDKGEPVATGIYMYRLQSGKESYTRKMLMMK